MTNRNSGGLVHPHLIADHRDYNLLLQAAEEGNDHVVKILCKMKLEAQHPQQDINAQMLAWNKKHFDVILTLLTDNLPFPPSFNDKECSKDIKKFIATNEELHEAIKAKNESKVSEILAENPKNSHFFNINNESAAKIALKCKFFSLYELLVSNKVYLGNHEAFNNIWGDFSETERKILREIHFKHSIFSPEKHLHDIALNSGAAHDDPEAKEKLNLAQYAFRILNGIPLIQIILMIVAASKKFKIIFEFKRDSVHVADPTADASSRGLFYTEGRIYIAAWHILQQSTEKEAFGTMAHELCHFAIYKVFENMAKPYYRKDKAGKEKFKEISRICKSKRGIEPIIDYVYDEYPPSMQHAELIVRVPHLIALYHDQPEKLATIREDFKELFTFYEKIVVPEMKRMLPKIENENQLDKKDKKIFKYKTLFIVVGVLSLIGLIASIITIKSIHKPFYSFNNLSDIDKSKVRDGLVKYKNEIVKFSELFSKNSPAYDKLTSEHIAQIFKRVPLDFSDSHFLYLNEHVYFEWNNLTIPLRNKLLNSNFSFQNETLTFKELKNLNSEAFSYLTSAHIINVLDGEKIQLGKVVEVNSEFYFQRYFELDQNMQISKKNNFKYSIRKNLSLIIEKVFGNETMAGNKAFILSANAGTGKTVTFQNMTIEIKKMFPLKWVSYVDLKSYPHIYKKITNTTNIDDIRELMKDILLADIKNEFEIQIYEKLFDSGKVVILWNGFDEIAPTYDSEVIKIFTFIYKTNNVQFICTRPYYSKKLEEIFSAIDFYTFAPLNIIEQENYLKMQFLFKNIKFEKIDELVQKVLSLMNGMSDEFNTPLMLKIFATISVSNVEFEIKNLYEIYSIFVKMQMQNWQSEGLRDDTLIKITMSSSEFNILKLYQKYALIYHQSSLFLKSEAFYSIKYKKLQILNLEHPKEISNEDISRLGILYHNGDQYEFIHRTFEEYFIAQYLIENIYNADSGLSQEEAEMRLTIFLLCYYRSFRVIFDFINSYFQSQNINGTKIFSQNILKHFERSKNNFLRVIDLTDTGLTPIILNLFKPDHYFITKLLDIYDDETLYVKLFNPIYYLNFNPSDVLHYFKDALPSENEFSLFINGQNQRGKILFGIFCYHKINSAKSHHEYKVSESDLNLSMSDFFTKQMKNLTIHEQKELFMLATSPKIHRVIDFTIEEYKYIWNNYSGIFDSLEMKIPLKNAFFYSLYKDFIDDFMRISELEFIDEILKFLANLIEKYFEDEEIIEFFKTNSILNRLAHNKNRFEYFWNFYKNHTTKYQQKEILMHFDDGNFIDKYYLTEPFQIIQRSLFSQNSTSFLYITDIYSKYFTPIELRQMITQTNEYLIYTFGDLNVNTCNSLTDYLQNLFKNDQLMLEEFLMRKIRPTKYSIFQYFSDADDETVLVSERLDMLLHLVSNETAHN